MKTQKNVLLLYFLWTMVVLLFLSCEKEESLISPLSPPVSCDSLADLTTCTTLAEALETFDSEGADHGSVAIQILSFANGEKKLGVYNPYKPKPNLYDAPEFSVYWFRNGILFDQKPQIGCTRNGEFTALVIKNDNGCKKVVGVDFYDILRSCHQN